MNLRAVVISTLAMLVASAAAPAGASRAGGDSWELHAAVLVDAGPAPVIAAADGSVVSTPAANRPQTAVFEVAYTGFPAAARQAFDAAADVWSRYIVSSVPIRIDARWQPLDDQRLGEHTQRSATWDPEVDSKLPVRDVLYPYSLAQAIGGKRTNANADARITLNANKPWYTGTDGRPGPDQLDLMTVALHEIGGSLGMSSAVNITASGRAFIDAEFPTIYDTLLTTSNGTSLLSLMKASPAAAAAEITGGWVYVRSNTVQATVAPAGVRVYGPRPFDDGSSLIHLSPADYAWPGDNSLMTPGTYRGTASHDPGPIALAILHDLGWGISGLGHPARVATSVLPSPAIAGQPLGAALVLRVLDPVGALVSDDNETVITAGYRHTGTAEIGCETSPAQRVTAGVATYSGCEADGSGFLYISGQSPDLVTGSSNITFVAATRRIVPSISSAP